MRRMSEICGGLLGNPEGYQKIFPPYTSVVSPTDKSPWSKMKELNIVSNSYVRGYAVLNKIDNWGRIGGMLIIKVYSFILYIFPHLMRVQRICLMLIANYVWVCTTKFCLPPLWLTCRSHHAQQVSNKKGYRLYDLLLIYNSPIRGQTRPTKGYKKANIASTTDRHLTIF